MLARLAHGPNTCLIPVCCTHVESPLMVYISLLLVRRGRPSLEACCETGPHERIQLRRGKRLARTRCAQLKAGSRAFFVTRSFNTITGSLNRPCGAIAALLQHLKTIHPGNIQVEQ